MTLRYKDVQYFVDGLSSIDNERKLHDLVRDVTKRMGFCYFAITEHINVRDGSEAGISVIHYPSDWEGLFRRKRLFGVDPVHRASHVRAMPFCWSDVSKIIPMTAQDHRVFELASDNGLGDGFTIPASIPGRMIGSCSFGMAKEYEMIRENLPIVAFVGQAAFEAAKCLRYGQWEGSPPPPQLTDRQLDCVALIAQGLTTAEISKALNVKYETAVQHIKDAAERYGVNRRAAIAIRALLDGSLCFSDVIPRS